MLRHQREAPDTSNTPWKGKPVPDNSLVNQVETEVAEWKRTRVYASVTTSDEDPTFRVTVDDEINVHMGHIYVSMSLTKWRELFAAVEAAATDAGLSA
ncbi:hypothetical protein JDBV06_00795 [Mycobacterium phage dwieneke]|nr:hypothetical protein JDBV06_00795 [Mycobacterium phage dwieneke]